MLTKVGDKPRISYFNNNNDDVIKKVLKIQKRIQKSILKIVSFFIHLVHNTLFLHIIIPSLF